MTSSSVPWITRTGAFTLATLSMLRGNPITLELAMNAIQRIISPGKGVEEPGSLCVPKDDP